MRPKHINDRVAPNCFYDDTGADAAPIVSVVVKIVALIFVRTKINNLCVEVAVEVDERLRDNSDPHFLGVSTH